MMFPDQGAHPPRDASAPDNPTLRSLIDRAICDERLRISRDLHDHTTQYATILKLRLQRVMSSSTEAIFLEEINKAIRDVDILIDGLRDIVDELRSPSVHDQDFANNLKTSIGEWSIDYGIPADIQIDPPDLNIRCSLARTLLHIAREALINIKNHARHVSHVTVTLQCSDDDVTLTIEDDGVGFDPQDTPPLGDGTRRRGLGLVGMRERLASVGGSMEVTSQPGSGTRIRARVSMGGSST